MYKKVVSYGLIVLVLATAAPTRAAEPDPAATVVAFNQSLSARKLDAALALLAPGAVQYTLRAVHAGVTTPSGSITSDLKNHWRTVGPVLFGVTKRYDRVARIEQTHSEGDLATVWATVSSKTVERSGKQRDDRFSEVYLLVRQDGSWKIGAIADNRGTDTRIVAD